MFTLKSSREELNGNIGKLQAIMLIAYLLYILFMGMVYTVVMGVILIVYQSFHGLWMGIPIFLFSGSIAILLYIGFGYIRKIESSYDELERLVQLQQGEPTEI